MIVAFLSGVHIHVLNVNVGVERIDWVTNKCERFKIAASANGGCLPSAVDAIVVANNNNNKLNSNNSNNNSKLNRRPSYESAMANFTRTAR